MYFSTLFVTFVVLVWAPLFVSADDVAGGDAEEFVSKCFDPTFESAFDNFFDRPVLRFGVTAFVDDQFKATVTDESLAVTMEIVNTIFNHAGVQFDTQVEVLPFPDSAKRKDRPSVSSDMDAHYDAWIKHKKLADRIDEGRLVSCLLSSFFYQLIFVRFHCFECFVCFFSNISSLTESENM
jgi:hypothetical protein